MKLVHLSNLIPKRQLRHRVVTWCSHALPGLVITGLVVIARFSGLLQGLELFALDLLLKARPAESQDEYIVLISIDRQDLNQIGNPIPNQEIINLVNTLQSYQPSVIGLNLLGSLLSDPSSKTLFNRVGRYKNLVVVEKLLSERIHPPAGFPLDQVGFTDIYLDGDNYLRRMLLGTSNPAQPDNPEEFRFSLAIRLAELYLKQQNIVLKNGDRDPLAMQLGTTELPRFLPNSGGYVNANANGVQILLNFRMGRQPFRTIPLRDIKSKRFDPEWLRGRVIIIGVTDNNLRTPIPTRVTYSTGFTESTHGVEVQAHTVSQILNSVLNQRPNINTWSEDWNYLWIVIAGGTGIIACQITQSFKQKIIVIGVIQISLLALSYFAINVGLWIPVIPILLILPLYLGLELILRYKLIEKQRTINQRQQIINHTFDVIHNGPLQNLNNVIRQLRDRNLTESKLLSELEELNNEIRLIGDYLKQESLSPEKTLYLHKNLRLDLTLPTHKLFFMIFTNTLERDFPEFRTLKQKVRHFDPIDDQYLSLEVKRELCLFLEEALINVGKHAEEPTYISAIGSNTKGCYTLRITDNGKGTCLSTQGNGSELANRLAAQLKGTFIRIPLKEGGTVCQLDWIEKALSSKSK